MFRILSKSKIGFLLAILFGISLLFFRSGSRDSNFFNSDTVVATVSGTPITTSKFNRAMQMNISKFNEVFGKDLNVNEIKKFNIQNLALNALISSAVFENEYDEINFNLDETVIAQKTKERIPQLFNSNNKLDETYLKNFLNQQQLKIEDIVQIINFETRDEYFRESFFKVSYPSTFTKKINAFENHKRSISYFDFDIENISIKELLKGESPDDNIIELEKYYNDNQSNYLTEEKRSVEFLIIDKKEFRNNFIPTNFEIEEYYNNNKQLFFEDEKRSFLQFNFKDLNKAKNFQEIIKDMTTKNILEYASLNNIAYKKFENLNYEEILEDLSKPLFNLQINQKSEIIETSLFKHILILQSIKKEDQLKLEKVKEKIISTIADIDSDSFFIDITNKISEEILMGKKIEDIANKFNLKIDRINNLTKNYKNTTQINKIILPDLVEKSFASNTDFISDVINLNENTAYVYNVINIEKSKPIILQSIKERIFKEWKYFKRSKKIISEINSNKNSLKYFENLSKNLDIEIKKIILSKKNTMLPYNLLDNIFKNDLNNTVQYLDGNSIYIARIDDIIIENESEITNLISLENNLKSSFGEILMKKKKVKLNEALIKALIERY